MKEVIQLQVDKDQLMMIGIALSLAVSAVDQEYNSVFDMVVQMNLLFEELGRETRVKKYNQLIKQVALLTATPQCVSCRHFHPEGILCPR